MKKPPFIIGLTGSIGMGKSTTADLFLEEGIDIWDADKAVERLYAKGGAAVEPLSKSFPEIADAGAVSKEKLKALIAQDPTVLPRVESIVHPLVAMDRVKFIANATSDIVLVDIPLLFEIGAEKTVDLVVVVSIDREIQDHRVLSRPGMTKAHYLSILAKQMPDHEKREKADRVITTNTIEHAQRQVREIIEDVRGQLENA